MQPGEVVSNDALRVLFAVGNMGGMRRSSKQNLLLIVSDHTKGLYEDRWEGDVLHYTGMGKKGPQKLDGNQNRTFSNPIQTALPSISSRYLKLDDTFMQVRSNSPTNQSSRRTARHGPVLLRRAQAIRADIDFFVALAHREYETWFIAAAPSLRGLSGLPPDLDSPPTPKPYEARRGG